MSQACLRLQGELQYVEGLAGAVALFLPGSLEFRA